MLTLFIAVRLLCTVTVALATQQLPLVVKTTSGSVQGFLDANTTSLPLNKWLGIPYAEDTSGQNRWRPPVNYLPNSSSVFNATIYGPACLQGRADGGNGTYIQSEDCLRINVIAPSNATNLPVYLYSHGGGFDSGASSDPKIDGSYLAARGIVFASYNYRLSLFGFPHAAEMAQAGETQNLGLLDTRAAVEWLYENVKQFGGDPKKITLGGESVGAEMTNLYMLAYHNKALIRGAVMQSGDTLQPMWQLNDQISKIAGNMSCPTQQGLLDCLRQKSGDELRQVLLSTGTQFQPVTDNITVWKDIVKQTKAGLTAKIPLLVGTNKDEGTLIVEGEPTAYLSDIAQYGVSNNLNFPFANLSFLQANYPVPSAEFPSAYNASAAMWRDAHMFCLASNLGLHRTRALRLPVWRYRFDHVASNLNSRGTRIGAFHGSDIRFVMGTWRTIVLSQPFVAATEDQIKISDLMVTAWTNFIKGQSEWITDKSLANERVFITLDPKLGPRIPGWEVYNPQDSSTLAILGISTESALPGDHLSVDKSCAYWNTLLPYFPQTFPKCGTWTC